MFKDKHIISSLTDKITFLLGKGSDLFFIVLMIVIIGAMIIPIPDWILDILFSLDIGIALSILIASIYIKKSIDISVFPSILLLTTLFRISLNISSTRLILLNGYAGRIIDTFGNFVVGGNFIVGGVVFVIITIVQFVVIAKGAERVAEVSARFALDAMPGKQMSIDADMRAGIIDAEKAKELRSELEKESRFYGAMDGAIKFVKGDAIAGIIITLINIIAGILIGIISKGMSIKESVNIYLILTVGDGLVSQIPALLISSSAGIVTTKVNGNNNYLLSRETIYQIFNSSRNLIIVSFIMMLFSILPGFPFVPFFIISIISGTIAYTMYIKSDKTINKEAKEIVGANRKDLQIVVPILIYMAPELIKCMEYGGNKLLIVKVIDNIRNLLFQQTGVRFPEILVKESVDDDCYVSIYIKELPVYQRRNNVKGSKILSGNEKTSEEKYEYSLVKSKVFNFLSNKLLMIDIKIDEQIKQVMFDIYEVLSKHAYEFIGINEVQEMLDSLEGIYPALVRNAIPKSINLPKLTDILRRLVKEGIPIKDLKTILESIIEYSQIENDPIMLTELVRSSLKRLIIWRFVSCNYNGDRLDAALVCYIIEPKLEMILQDAINHSSAGSYLALEPEISLSIINKCKELFSNNGKQIIIVTQMEIRYFVKKMLEIDFPDIIVLSYQELPNNVKLQPIGRISLE